MIRDAFIVAVTAGLICLITIMMLISLDESMKHEELKAQQYQKEIYLNSQD